jgi:hypothetical protein
MQIAQRMNIKLLLAASLLASACVADEDIDDPIDESFLNDGKEDAFGIHDGSPEAYGVLQLVNTTDRAVLRDKVHLTENATKAILDYRKREGIDTWFNPFDSLKELDDIAYVGASAFGKLRAYAEANGYVTPDPFQTTCSGPTIDLTRLQEITANGTAKLPSGGTWIRTRSCNGPLGCGAWSAPKKLGEPRNTSIEYAVAGAKIRFQAKYHRSVATLLPQGYLDNISELQWNTLVTPGTPSTLAAPTGFSYTWFGSNVTTTRNFSKTEIAFTNHCMRSFGQLTLENQTQPTTEVIHLVEL